MEKNEGGKKMMYHYHKLVRDNIPDEINKIKGRKATWRLLKEEEYKQELNKKLLEEANEFIEAHEIEELADLMEVIQTIMELENIDIQKVREKQQEKRNKKGSFKDRIYLEMVEQENDKK